MHLEFVSAPVTPVPAEWSGPLIERGFTPARRAYRKEDLTFTLENGWFVLREDSHGTGDTSLARNFGQTGLWKSVRNGTSHRVFEIPTWAVVDPHNNDRLDESGPASAATLLDWALASRFGRVGPDWNPPEETLLRSWEPRAITWTAQSKGYVRQTEVVHQPNRWALRIPLLHRLPDDLPEPRRLALMELVAESNLHWAMIRLGFPPDASPAALVAEVDLSGAPHSELLFSAGLDALKGLIENLVETAEVLSDPTVVIASLTPGGDLKNSNAEANIT